MANILVVEDNVVQRENLIKMIKEVDEEINIYEADSKEEALKVSEEVKIDFFYIDISLRDSSGLELASELRNVERYKFSWIVFITTHISYMIQAFKEIHCYDYILKPYDKDKVIDMTKLLISGSHTLNSSKSKDKHVILKLQKGISMKINIYEIIFVEVNLMVMTIYTKHGKYRTKRLSLRKVLEIIDSDTIIQSHKSFAVNTSFISMIESISNRLWEISFLDYEEKALLSYKFKEAIMKRFKESI